MRLYLTSLPSLRRFPVAGVVLGIALTSVAIGRAESADGTPDLGFGTAGIVRTAPGSRPTGRDLVVQNDGKIIVVGDSTINGPQLDVVIARYLPNGSLDTGFGSTGRVITPDGGSYAVALQSDGRFIVIDASWGFGLTTSTPGRSGQPGSEHYSDLLPMWAKGEYFPLAYSSRKIAEITAHTLWLKPVK